MEIEYYNIKQWMGWDSDQGRNQKVSGNKWKLTKTQNLWDTAKAVLKGSS